MSNKLFVGGLSWGTDDNGLHAAFSRFGNVSEAKVISDRETGRSRGFGFVTFADAAQADAAMKGLDGTSLDGRTLKVNVAQERERNDRGGDRGGYDRRPSSGGGRW